MLRQTEVIKRAAVDNALLQISSGKKGARQRHGSAPEGVVLNKHWALKEVLRELTAGSNELLPAHAMKLLEAVYDAQSASDKGIRPPSAFEVKLVMTDLAKGELRDTPEGHVPAINQHDFVQASNHLVDECDPTEDLEEIWQLMLLPRHFQTRQDLEAAELDAASLAAGLQRLGCAMSEDEVRDFIAFDAYGSSGKASLTYKGFQDLVMTNCAPGWHRSAVAKNAATNTGRRRTAFVPLNRQLSSSSAAESPR